MQLVAYGAQDIYLTGNPQITFFKVVYRRHTNFSMESIQQTWNGTSSGADGSRCTSTISRNGDLVHKMYIQVEKVNTIGKINGGADWIRTATLEIGGQQIDKITGQWMEVWSELTESNPTGATLNGSSNGTLFQNMSGFGGVLNGQTVSASNVYVPLPFWFCRNPGLALPLIALQYHEVKLVLEHGLTDVISGTVQNLWVDYIYLDTDERRRFAQVSHEYLIEQLQYQQMTEQNQRLNFNHPVKELVWCNASTAAGSISHAELLQNASAVSSDTTWQLKLNGHDRFAARPTTYFTRQQVYDYHSGHGGVNTAADYSSVFDSIFVYSFALKPEEHQPSGTCNFSRIDNAELKCSGTDGGFDKTNSAWTVYAVNYNVLRIMSGMGGLAYSN